MSADELHEHAAEGKRHVDDQPIFVAAEIEDDPVVAHEIDGVAELPPYLGRIRPTRLGRGSEPRPSRALGMWVTRPEFLESPKGDHLHGEALACHQSGDNPASRDNDLRHSKIVGGTLDRASKGDSAPS